MRCRREERKNKDEKGGATDVSDLGGNASRGRRSSAQRVPCHYPINPIISFSLLFSLFSLFPNSVLGAGAR